MFFLIGPPIAWLKSKLLTSVARTGVFVTWRACPVDASAIQRRHTITLIEGGERLFRSLHGAFLEVAQSVDTLRPQRSGSSLTLSTTAAFAALWLVPRLGRFYAKHPNINVRLDTHCEVIDLHQDASVDLVHFTILRPPEKQDGTPINEQIWVMNANGGAQHQHGEGEMPPRPPR